MVKWDEMTNIWSFKSETKHLSDSASKVSKTTTKKNYRSEMSTDNAWESPSLLLVAQIVTVKVTGRLHCIATSTGTCSELGRPSISVAETRCQLHSNISLFKYFFLCTTIGSVPSSCALFKFLLPVCQRAFHLRQFALRLSSGQPGIILSGISAKG